MALHVAQNAVRASGPKTGTVLDGFGSELLVRTASGAVVAVTPGGGARDLVPTSCLADLLYADAPRGQVVVACQGPTDNRSLEIFGRRGHVDLKRSLAPYDVDVYLNPKTHQLHVGYGVVVDLESRSLVAALPQAEARLAGEEVLAVRSDGRVLVAAGNAAVGWQSVADGPLMWIRPNPPEKK